MLENLQDSPSMRFCIQANFILWNTQTALLMPKTSTQTSYTKLLQFFSVVSKTQCFSQKGVELHHISVECASHDLISFFKIVHKNLWAVLYNADKVVTARDVCRSWVVIQRTLFFLVRSDGGNAPFLSYFSMKSWVLLKISKYLQELKQSFPHMCTSPSLLGIVWVLLHYK